MGLSITYSTKASRPSYSLLGLFIYRDHAEKLNGKFSDAYGFASSLQSTPIHQPSLSVLLNNDRFKLLRNLSLTSSTNRQGRLVVLDGVEVPRLGGAFAIDLHYIIMYSHAPHNPV